STSVAAGGDCATTASSTLACDEDGWEIILKYGDSTETRRESDGEVYVDTESLSGFVKVYTCRIPASSFEIIDTETCCGDEAPEVVTCCTVEYTLASC